MNNEQVVATLTPAPSSLGVSDRMSRQRTRDTVPELELRRALHARGVRYRVDYPLPGMPRRRADVVFTRVRLAVFVDGCFWHCCPEHASYPRANSGWWRAKLARNVERDRETDGALLAAGWTVLRFWGHDDMHAAASAVVAKWAELRG